MATTFDIRFDRSGGFAGMFEAPTNSFRWKGGGLLSIDPNGVSIAMKRGLLSLLTRRQSQRIPAANLTEVYREGEALRVEFATAENAREVVPFWVRDGDTAAAIVKLLPTTRTVEMEHSTAPRDGAKFRVDWRTVVVLGFAVLVLASALFVIERNGGSPEMLAPAELDLAPSAPGSPVDSVSVAPATDTSPEVPAESFIEPVPTVISPPSLPGTQRLADPADLAMQIPRDSPAYPVARDQLRNFAAVAAGIEANYRVYHRLFMSRDITTEEFLEKLADYEMRWWDFTYRILDNDALADPALVDLRAALLASARHWRNFFNGYARGLRTGDHLMIARAFDELTLAEELRARLRSFFQSSFS